MSILTRAKQLAEMKRDQLRARAKEEAEYQAFSHPDISFLRGGQTTTDYEKAGRFAARKDGDRERDVKLRAKAGTFMGQAKNYLFSEQGAPSKSRKPAGNTGFGAMPDMGYLLNDTKKRRRK